MIRENGLSHQCQFHINKQQHKSIHGHFWRTRELPDGRRWLIPYEQYNVMTSISKRQNIWTPKLFRRKMNFWGMFLFLVMWICIFYHVFFLFICRNSCFINVNMTVCFIVCWVCVGLCAPSDWVTFFLLKKIIYVYCACEMDRFFFQVKLHSRAFDDLYFDVCFFTLSFMYRLRELYLTRKVTSGTGSWKYYTGYFHTMDYWIWIFFHF